MTVSRRPLAGAGAEIRALLAADLPRNHAPSARLTLVIQRCGQVLYRRRGLRAFVLRRLVQVADSVWTRGVIGAEIPTCVWIGPGLRLPHAGRGIVMHPTVEVGAGCTIYHRVSLGVRDERGGPRVGDDVEIGTGAAILGPITVADGCRVGANAVLVTDTEPGTNYGGVPARALTRAPR